MLAEQKMTLWLEQPHTEPLLHPTAKARWRSRSVAAGNSLPKGLRALRVPQPSLSCKKPTAKRGSRLDLPPKC